MTNRQIVIKRYYAKHKREILKKSREYYRRNRRSHILKTKKWAQEHREEYRKMCRDYYRKHKQKIIEKSRIRNATPRGRYMVCRNVAKVRGIPFRLSKKQFIKFWNKPCFYCGNGIETVGLDRVDNKFGYNINNVVSCCWFCNTSKMDMSQQEFIERCNKISKLHPIVN